MDFGGGSHSTLRAASTLPTWSPHATREIPRFFPRPLLVDALEDLDGFESLFLFLELFLFEIWTRATKWHVPP